MSAKDPLSRDLFAQFLEAYPEADRVQFEEWQARYPEHALELEGYMDELEHLREMLDLPGESIAAHLIENHGFDVDPAISLGQSEVPSSLEAPINLTPHLPEGKRSSRRYRLRRELGRGGMGTVLEVWDQDLRRRVAMKVTRKGAAGLRSLDSRALARFLEEAQITGQLDHPGVVPVHELGLNASGEVFFTMRLVRGRDLEQVLRGMEAGEGDWSMTRALGVLLRVCEAVAYAHSRGVIHRDLKPANIMVGRFGQVYVMDWGLAKVLGRSEPAAGDSEPGESLSQVASLRQDLDDADSDSPVFTREGEVMGTPAYMSPEQARGDLDALGPPSDVYSVGSMLYRILTGKHPYQTGGRQAARDVMIAVATGPPPALTRLARHAPAELSAICDKAMARGPSDRYPNMGDMANDLRAFLEGRVVQAFGHGPLMELRKWVERNRILATVAIVAVLAILGITTRAALVQAASNRELREAQINLTSLVSDDLVGRDPAAALAVALRMPLGEDEFPVRTAVLGAMQRLQEERFLPGFSLSSISTSADVLVGWHRDSDTVRGWDVKTREFVAEYPSPAEGDELRVFASPAGSIAVVCGTATCWLLTMPEGRWIPLRGPGLQARGTSVAFHPDDDRFLIGRADGKVQLWSRSGEHLADLEGHQGAVSQIAVHSSGEFAVSASGSPRLSMSTDRTLRVWDLRGRGSPGAVIELDEEPTSMALHPSEPWMIAGDILGGLRCFDLATGDDRSAPPPVGGIVLSIDIQRQGKLIAIGSEAGLTLFTADWKSVSVPGFPHASRGVTSVSFDASGRRLLSVGFDLSAQVWSLEPRNVRWGVRASVPARGHRQLVTRGEWLGEHGRFLTIDRGGAHIWFAHTSPFLPRIQDRGRHPVCSLAFSDEAHWVYMGREGRGVEGLRFEPGVRAERAFFREPPEEGASPLLLDASRGRLLVVWSTGLIERCDPETGQPQGQALEMDTPLRMAQLGARGELLLLAGERGRAALLDFGAPWPASSDQPVRLDIVLDAEVSCLAVHPDGDWVALGTERGMINVLPRAGDSQVVLGPVASETRQQTAIFGLAFDPTRPELASSGPDRSLRLWNFDRSSNTPLATGRRSRTPGVVTYVNQGAQLIVQYQWGGAIWEVDREDLDVRRGIGQAARQHRNMVPSWAFDRTGTHMLTASKDQTALWWDLEARQPLLVFRGHAAPLTVAALSRDAAWAATGDEAGTVRIWPLDPIKEGRRAMPYDPARMELSEMLPEVLANRDR